MAHGNISDLVALSLIALSALSVFAPEFLFQDLGPIKASFTHKSQDLDLMIKFGAGMTFAIAMMFSGIKWNPGNGKMAGLGCFVFSIYNAYSVFKQDSDVFVPRLLYVYSAVLFIGGLHIFLFPSNPALIKNEKTKNNHGNTSDIIALLLIGAALQSLFYPEPLYQSFGAVKANLGSKSTDVETMVKFCGGLLFIIGMTFSGVKWNPVNGKMSGMGGLICAGYTAYSTFKQDSDTFVPRPFYLYALVIFLGSAHVFAFPSNPMPEKPKPKSN